MWQGQTISMGGCEKMQWDLSMSLINCHHPGVLRTAVGGCYHFVTDATILQRVCAPCSREVQWLGVILLVIEGACRYFGQLVKAVVLIKIAYLWTLMERWEPIKKLWTYMLSCNQVSDRLTEPVKKKNWKRSEVRPTGRELKMIERTPYFGWEQMHCHRSGVLNLRGWSGHPFIRDLISPGSFTSVAVHRLPCFLLCRNANCAAGR